MLVDSSSLWFRVLAARYGVEGGGSKGEAVGHQCGGATFLHCVKLVGLVIMFVVLLVMGNIHFFGRMSRLVGCRLVLDLVVYMTYQCLRSHLYSI